MTRKSSTYLASQIQVEIKMCFWEMSCCFHSLQTFIHLKLAQIIYFCSYYWSLIVVQYIFLVRVQDFTVEEMFWKTVRRLIIVSPGFNICCLPIRQMTGEGNQFKMSMIAFIAKPEKNERFLSPYCFLTIFIFLSCSWQNAD